MMFNKSFIIFTSARSLPKTPLFPSSRTFTFQAPRLAKSSTRKALNPNTKTKPAVKQPIRNSGPQKTTTDIRYAGRGTGGLAELDRKVVQKGEYVLFKASSQRAYIFGAYGIAAFSFGYALINSSLGLQDTRAQLAYWQKGLYVGVCVVMSVMGTVFLSRTSRLVKEIIAVDVKGRTLLNVNVRSVMPFRKPYTITVAPNQMIFSDRLVAGSFQPGAPRFGDMKISFFKNPLKAINFAFFRVFIAIRRIFTQEDFIMMEMQGQKGSFRVGMDGYVSEDLLAITLTKGRK